MIRGFAIAAIMVGCAARAGVPPVPAPTPQPASEPVRGAFTVASDPGITIAVHQIAVPGARGTPVLLVHGAGLGSPCFDLPVPGYSLAEDLALAGHPAYALDVRGWGRSTRPPAFDGPPDAAPPAVSSDEAVRDIAAVVGELRRRHGGARIALLGWATGGHWAGMYAASQPDAVDRVVMVNSLYGTPGPWSLRAALADPAAPDQFSRQTGAYALRDGRSLVGRWEATIPGDKAEWRDPRVAEAYIAAALASDPTSSQREPPTVRVATGPLRDSFQLAGGTRMWEASQITAPVLVIRGELDFWSRPEDVEALRRDLRAPGSRIVTIPGATHFVLFDRPERGRAQVLDELRAFFAGPGPAPAP